MASYTWSAARGVVDAGRLGAVMQHPPTPARSLAGQWRTLLFRAARDGDLTSVRGCLSNGGSKEINATDATGETPLHVAAFRGYLTIVQVLVDAGADIHAQDAKGGTPLHSAVNGCDMQVFTFLLSCGAHIDAQDHRLRTPPHYASEWGDAHVVRFLLNCGANPNVRDAVSRLPRDMTRRSDIRGLLSQPQVDLHEASAQRKMAFRVLDDLLREEERSLLQREREMQAQRAVRLQRRLDYESRAAKEREQAMRTRSEIEAYVKQERRMLADSVAEVKRRAQSEAHERRRRERLEQQDLQMKRLTTELERTWRQLEVSVLKVPKVTPNSRRHVVVATTFTGLEGWDPNAGLNGIGQFPTLEDGSSEAPIVGSAYGHRMPERSPPPLANMYGVSWAPSSPHHRAHTAIPHSHFSPKQRHDSKGSEASQRSRSANAVVIGTSNLHVLGDSDVSSSDEDTKKGYPRLGVRPKSSLDRTRGSHAPTATTTAPTTAPATVNGHATDASQSGGAHTEGAAAAEASATHEMDGTGIAASAVVFPATHAGEVGGADSAVAVVAGAHTSPLESASASASAIPHGDGLSHDSDITHVDSAATSEAPAPVPEPPEQEPAVDPDLIFGKPITEGAVVVVNRSASKAKLHGDRRS
eukprot:Opistho-2@53195